MIKRIFHFAITGAVCMIVYHASFIKAEETSIKDPVVAEQKNGGDKNGRAKQAQGEEDKIKVQENEEKAKTQTGGEKQESSGTDKNIQNSPNLSVQTKPETDESQSATEKIRSVASLKDLIIFYEKEIASTKKMIERWNKRMKSSIERESNLKSEMEALRKDLSEKKESDPKLNKKEILRLEKRLERLLKEEKIAKEEREELCQELSSELKELYKETQTAVKEKFQEIQKEVESSGKEGSKE